MICHPSNVLKCISLCRCPITPICSYVYHYRLCINYAGPIGLSVESALCNSMVDVTVGAEPRQTTLSCTATTVGGASCIEWEWSLNDTTVSGSTSELTVSNTSSTGQHVTSNSTLVVTTAAGETSNYTCTARLCRDEISASASSCWIFITGI